MKKKILALGALMTVSIMLTACTSADDVNNKLGEEKSFTHGTLTETSYTSDLFGIEMEFGSGWTAMTDEEMAEQNQIDDMTDESMNEALDSKATVYEMMANIESGSNVNIVIENLKITNNGNSITAEKYMELALPNLKTGLTSTYGEATADIGTVEICSKTMPCINAEISNSGVTLHETLIPVIKGNYAAVVTLTALDDDDMNTLINAFKSIG